MDFARGLRLVALLTVCAALLLAQGLTTTATKDDWEEINFEFNSSVLSDGYPSLLRLAELLHQNPDYKVTLDGNTDWVGSDRFNDKLANTRAATVQSFLAKYGANANQISTVAHGKRQPKVSNKSKEGRFINRRVVLIVTDGHGKIVSAGGVGDAIKAMQAAESAAKAKESLCCDAILKRLDKLDEILAAVKDLKAENDRLKQDVAALQQAQTGVQKQVADLPRPPEKDELQKMMDTTANNAIQKAKPSRFSLLGVNVGPMLGDMRMPFEEPAIKKANSGSVTFTGKGRYFAPFGKAETAAVQAEGEYMYYRDRQEGQFDLGLVNRWTRLQGGLFSSFKHVNIAGIGGGTIAQAAFTADVLFSRGKFGFFGTKSFLDDSVLGRTPFMNPVTGTTLFNVWNEYYLKVVDQVGASAQIALWNDAYVEGNLGALFRPDGGTRPGGTVRLVQPFSPHIAGTLEASLNETLLGVKNTGRVAFGLQFGNWVKPKDFMTVKHPVPVDIPRVRYEVLSRIVRTGNNPPVADAGGDQIGIPAGAIGLDASASYSPEGLALTFQWTQIAGPTVTLTSPTSAKTTFNASDGQTYQFKVTVKDTLGQQASARTTVQTKAAPTARILSFTANPTTIKSGATSTLAWQVENADTVTISGLGQVNPQGGTATVAPTQTTTYTLTATNAKGQVNQVVTVVVKQAEVQIVSFQANPSSIMSGQASVLLWQTRGADTVSISSIGSVAQNGSTSVSPTTTTTYTLTASSQQGQQTTATVTVTVNVPPPTVLFFTATPSQINEGDSSTLQWQTNGATSVTISGIGTVPNTGSQNVSPATTTTYTLTATNASGQTQAAVVVTVIPGPKILSFTANPAVINAGQKATLTWSTQNGQSAFIANFGTVPVNGSVDVSPTKTTTYTLQLTKGTRTVTQDVTVTVNTVTPPTPQPPTAVISGPSTIETIYRQINLDGSHSTSPGGGQLTYKWTVTPSTANIFSPSMATTTVQMPTFGIYIFTLTVTDSAGQSSSASVTVNFKKVETEGP